MILYAKVEDKDTKECSVGVGTDIEFYKSIGMEEMDVEEAYNGRWYLKGHAPVKPAPTWEEVDRMRKQYREMNIDPRTNARVRKTANGTWTEQDEQEYLALDAQVTAYIEEHFPYPVENDPEYDTQVG